MKEELELKHLAPYLPYGLKISPIHILHGHTGIGSIEHVVQAVNEGKSQYKPILRPLSYLTKKIEVNGEKFIPLYKLIKEDKAFTTDFIYAFGYEELKVSVYELLLEWHFDVYGLIEQGLAIDINTLNK